jgi:hypothetical protein
MPREQIQKRLCRWLKGLRRRGVVVMLSLLAVPSFCQMPANTPPPSANAAATVDDAECQRILDEKIEVIRKTFVAGDYAQVLQLCDEAELIAPRNSSVALYREWARQRMQRVQIGQHADVDKAELPTEPASRQAPPIQPSPTVTEQTGGQKSASSLPSAGGESSAASPAAKRPSSVLLGVAAAVLGLLVVGYVGVVLYAKKRARREAISPATVEPRSESISHEIEEEPARREPPSLAEPGRARPSESQPTPSLAAPGLGIAANTPSSPAMGLGLGLAGAPSLGDIVVPHAPKEEAEEPLRESTPSPSQAAVGPGPEFEPPPLPAEEPWSAAVDDLMGSVPTTPEPPPSTGGQLGFVSLEDLGIKLPSESNEPPPSQEKVYAAAIDESRIVITPVPKKPVAGEPPPRPEEQGTEGETIGGALPHEVPIIQLEDIVGLGPEASPVSQERVDTELPTEEAPKPEAKPLQPVMQEKEASPADDTLGLEALTLDLAEEEWEGLSSEAPAQPVSQVPSPENEDASTVVLSSPLTKPTEHRDDNGETKTIAVNPPDALAETKVVEVPTTIASAKQSAEEGKQPKEAAEAATPDASQTFQQKKLDERSERMFREQWERGLRAFEEGNYKQAVHFLSIAAAIHPENQEVREKLREARERKRQQDEASR